jgi:hypothetical protein
MRIVRSGRVGLVASGLVLLAGTGLAADRDVRGLVEPLLRAHDDRAVGAVVARAYVEPTRPGAGPAPQPSVLIHLVPYSTAFDAELDAVKAGLRDSLEAYAGAVSRIEGSRVDYERALVAAGGGTLVRTGITDSEGVIRLAEVPAGEWLALAWREGGHFTKRTRVSDKDAEHYPDLPTTTTYSMVTYWRARVKVSPREAAQVALSDRNVWMTAPRHEAAAPRRPRSPETGVKKRR